VRMMPSGKPLFRVTFDLEHVAQKRKPVLRHKRQ
jgi:hypothetical protein